MKFHFSSAKPEEVWPLIRDYHYSRKMPSAILHCYVWRKDGGLFGDFGEPVAAVVYGNPVNRHWPQDALELQRLVRREDCRDQLSQLVSWSLRWLRKTTDAPFVLSYADSAEGHHGGIYQAAGFSFVGSRTTTISAFLLPDGSKKHSRQVNRELGSRSIPFVAEKRPEWVPIKGEPKHLYVMPLRQQLKPLMRRLGLQRLPYPKPNAACPADAPVPTGASREHPPEAAPDFPVRSAGI